MPKTLVPVLITCVALIASGAGGSSSQDTQAEKILQPQALDAVGIYALRQIEPNLTGAGVKVAVISRSLTYIDGQPQNDYQPNIQHNCFDEKQFSFHDSGQLTVGISPHSTAICSILFGAEPNAANRRLGQFNYQGVVPQAKADVYEFRHFLSENVFSQSCPDVDVVSVSIGSGFEDWWTRGIDAMAQQQGLVVVASIGNGVEAYDPLLYPGASANVIGVGVVDSVNTEDLAIKLANFALAYPGHSSFGPTADGRCKPDIVAPGNSLAADANELNSFQPTGDWSSFSAPLVAGAIGLLTQKAKQDPNLSLAVSPDGGNCVMKAILMNSAKKLPYWHKGKPTKDDDHTAPLDYIQGAGMLNAAGAYEHLIAGPQEGANVTSIGWDNNLLIKNTNSENTYKITIAEPAGNFITATAVWNRHYDNSYPFEPQGEKDADLRLEIWAVDSNDSNNGYLLDYSDSQFDNVEHIYCSADANYTDYEIIISYSSIGDINRPDISNRYGLAWNVSKKQDDDNIFWYDLNADGMVNDLDLAALLDNWTASVKQPGSYFLGDINADGVFDAGDLQILMSQQGRKADWHTE